MGDERSHRHDGEGVRPREPIQLGLPLLPEPPRGTAARARPRTAGRVVRTAYVYEDGSIVYADGRGEVLADDDADVPGRDDKEVAVVTSPRAAGTALRRASPSSPPTTAATPPPRLGDAAPLALMAFGSTTVLFCSHVAGTSPLNTVTIAQLIFYGGLTQLICGILELINRNTFAFSAFCTYGAFWLHLAGGELLPRGGALSASTLGYEGGHAIVWFVISLTFLCCSLRQPLVTIAVFATLTLFFVIFAIGNFADVAGVRQAAGYEGIVCGSLALYLAASLLLRDAYDGRAFLPIFHHRGWRITAW